MKKKNESKKYSDFSVKYLLEEKQLKEEFKNEINYLKQLYENNSQKILEMKNTYDFKFNEINMKYNETLNKYNDTKNKLDELTIKFDEVTLKYNDAANKLDEVKKENKLLKELVIDNKEEVKVLKDLNEKILEKLTKDQSIYDTYQEKIYNINVKNSELDLNNKI